MISCFKVLFYCGRPIARAGIVTPGLEWNCLLFDLLMLFSCFYWFYYAIQNIASIVLVKTGLQLNGGPDWFVYSPLNSLVPDFTIEIGQNSTRSRNTIKTSFELEQIKSICGLTGFTL